MPDKRISPLRILAEILVIFLGVTLSLVADDWREGRASAETQRAVLTELSEDLASDYDEMKDISDLMRGWDAASMWLIQARGRPSEASDSALVQIGTLSWYRQYQAVHGAYDALGNGGQIGLIEDLSLRRDLVDYYERSQVFLAWQYERCIKVYDNELTPLFWSHLAMPPSQEATSFDPAPEPRFTTSFAEFIRDPRAERTLSRTGLTAASWIRNARRAMEVNVSLRERIEELLAESG